MLVQSKLARVVLITVIPDVKLCVKENKQANIPRVIHV